MKIVYLCLLMFLLSSPVVKTRKLRMTKKKVVPLLMAGGAIGVAIVAGKQIFNSLNNYYHTRRAKKIYSNMVQIIKERNTVMFQMITKCRKSTVLKDKITAALTEMLNLSSVSVNMIEEVGCFTKTESFSSNEGEDKEMFCRFLDLLKGTATQMVGRFSSVLSIDCQDGIFSFLDTTNSQISSKKSTITKIEEDLINARTLTTKIFDLVKGNNDLTKMANSINFGSDVSKVEDPNKKNKDFQKKWLYANISSGLSYSKAFVINTASLLGFYHGLGSKVKSKFTNILKLFLKKAFKTSESSGITQNIADDFSISNQIFADAMHKFKPNDFDNKLLKYTAYLQQIQRFNTFSKFYSLVDEAKAVNQAESKEKEDLPETIDYSVRFRYLGKENRLQKEAFGLYFADIDVVYTEEEAQAKFRDGFEAISAFNIPEEKDAKELLILGRRRQDSEDVLLFVDAVPFSEFELKVDELGSDYQESLKDRLYLLLRKRLFEFYESNCGNLQFKSDIYSLIDRENIKMRLSYKHYVISGFVKRELFDKEENKKFVNCLNKYKKLEGIQELSICKKNKDKLAYFCIKSQRHTVKTVKVQNIKETLGENQIYYLIRDKEDLKFLTREPARVVEGCCHRNILVEQSKFVFSESYKKEDRFDLFKLALDGVTKNSVRDVFYKDVLGDSHQKYKFHKVELKFDENSLKYVNSKDSVKTFLNEPKPRKHEDLMLVKEGKKTKIPINDYIQSALGMELDASKAKKMNSAVPLSKSKAGLPFYKVFTGYYFNNSQCRQFSRFLRKPYVRPYLLNEKWTKDIVMSEAIKSILEYGDTNIENKEIKGRKFKISKFVNFRLKRESKGDYEIDALKGKETEFKKAMESLKACKFASLPIGVKFKDSTIKRPKLSIFSLDNDIEFSLTEDPKVSLKYTKELAITFTYFNTSKDAEIEKIIKENNVGNTTMARRFSMGFFKIEDEFGRSDIKMRVKGTNACIIMTVWSKLAMKCYKKQIEKYENIAGDKSESHHQSAHHPKE